MTTPITYDQMKDLLNGQASTFASALRGSPGSSSSPAPSSSGGGGITGQNAKDVNSAVGSVISGFERAGKGGSAVGEVLSGVSAGLGKINVLGVQQGFDAMRGSVEGTTNMQRQFVNNGLLAAGQTAEWGKKIADTGGNIGSFQSQFDRYKTALGGLSSTNEGTAKELLAFQKDFRESKIGKTLESIGFVPEQINEIATNGLVRSQNLNLQDEKSRRDAIKSVGEFTMATLGAASATNKTTEQLLRENSVRSEDLDVNLALLAGGKDMSDSYRALKNVTGELGSELQGSIDEIFAMGVVTEKAGNNLSAIGPAGTALGEAALALRNAKTEEQRKEAEQRLQVAKNNMDTYMRQQGPGGFAAQAQSQKYTDDAVGQSMRRIAGQEMTRLQMQNTGAQNLGARNQPNDTAAVKAFQASQMAGAMSGRDATGAKAPGTELYQNIVAADVAARNNYNKLVSAGYDKFTGAVDNFSKAVLIMPGAKAVKTGQEATPAEARTPVATPDRRGARAGGSPGLDDLLGNVKQETAGVPKGWMEALEKFDPNGEMVQLDGEEVVANKKQWTAIGEALKSKMSKMPDVSKTIEDVAGKFSPDMFKPITSSMSDMMKPIGNMSMPSTDGIFGSLKGMTAGLSSELGTRSSNTESTSAAPAPARQESAVLPNQDMLAGLLEKLNTNMAGMGGLLQEGNQIAQSGNNQLASAADNRFTIG